MLGRLRPDAPRKLDAALALFERCVDGPELLDRAAVTGSPVVTPLMFEYRIRKYVGAYTAVLGHVDAVIFTAGVGENDAIVRGRSLGGLETLGIAIDSRRNTAPSREPRFVSPDGARVAVLVVPTDEELEMATQAAALVSCA